MNALVLTAYNRLTYREVPDPEIGPHGVLVRVERCGICGSDVHGMDGSSGRRIPPVIMGHEASGVAEAVGPSVRTIGTGERVTFDSTVYCGRCRYCLSGRINLCDNRRVLGVSCDEYRRDGAFAEYVSVPERIVYRLPDDVDFDQAALAEPLSIAAHAVELAGTVFSRRVAVVGAGVIGSCLISMLSVAGCESLIAVEPDESRRARAERLGADAVLHPDETAKGGADGGPAGADSGPAGADLVFEAVGIPATVDTSIRLVRKGGTVVLVGNVTPSVAFPLQSVVTREIRVLGSCASVGEYTTALSLLERGLIKHGDIISAVAPLSEGASWFDRLYRREKGLLKVLLAPRR